MDGAGGQFLALPASPRDQDRARRAGNGLEELEQIPHDAALPDEPIDPVAILQLRPQVCVLRLQAPLLDRLDDVQSASNWKGLVTKSAAPCLIASTASFTVLQPVITIAMMSGYRRARRRARRAPDSREPEVGDQDVESEPGEQRQRFLAAACLYYREPVVRQPFRDCRSQRRLVVYDQQMFLGISHLGRAAVWWTPRKRRVNASARALRPPRVACSLQGRLRRSDTLSEPKKVAHQ